MASRPEELPPHPELSRTTVKAANEKNDFSLIPFLKFIGPSFRARPVSDDSRKLVSIAHTKNCGGSEGQCPPEHFWVTGQGAEI